MLHPCYVLVILMTLTSTELEQIVNYWYETIARRTGLAAKPTGRGTIDYHDSFAPYKIRGGISLKHLTQAVIDGDPRSFAEHAIKTINHPPSSQKVRK